MINNLLNELFSKLEGDEGRFMHTAECVCTAGPVLCAVYVACGN